MVEARALNNSRSKDDRYHSTKNIRQFDRQNLKTSQVRFGEIGRIASNDDIQRINRHMVMKNAIS